MSAPIRIELLKTIKSTLDVHFTGILCGESENRPHNVSIELPTTMFDAKDAMLVQYTLLVLSGGKMYREVNNLYIEENAIESEVSGP